MKKKAILINYTGRKGSGTWDAYGMAKALIAKGICCVGVFSSDVENKNEIQKLAFDKIVFIPTYSNMKSFILESLRFSKKHRNNIIKEFENYNIENIYCPIDTQWEKKISDCFPKAKVYLVCHEPLLKKGDNWITYKIFRTHMKKADAVIVHSKVFIDVVKRISKKPTYYMPLGQINYYGQYDDKKSMVTYSNSTVNYLFFGRIAENKGLDILAEAYRKVYDELDNSVSLSVIGNGDFSLYEKLYRHLSNVTIINRWIEDREVESIFLGHNLILICPYKEGSQSGVIQVARDYGIPMIVTNVGGLSEQVENEITGLVTNVDADEIAAAMIRLANDKELYNQISRNEKEEAKKYTWENSAVYLIDIMGEKNEN